MRTKKVYYLIMNDNIHTIEELSHYVTISPTEKQQLEEIIRHHPMSIPKYYLSLIDKDDPNDPIRKMAVPSKDELNLDGEYDTSGEISNTKMLGLQHKYSQTALILATNKCTMYCRYCFRKRLIGISNSETLKNFDNALEYIKEHKEINNILLSGGDPFSLKTELIEEFLEKLSKIKHLNFIRFGTKIPVTSPYRIINNAKLLNVLKKYSKLKKISISTQFNHPKEITNESTEAINKLIENGISLNNQTVLLKGINDDAKILVNLKKKLTEIGIIPYYIFQCRPVKRVKNHFQVPLYKGYEIIEEAKKYLNGYSKRFRYIMSHESGKIEIVGIIDNEIYLKYHQAKEPENIGKLFKKKLNKNAGWLDELD